MKVVIAGLIGPLLLAGCIAVPVVEPAPVAGYYYSPPAAVYYGHRHPGWRHSYRPHRHYRGW